MIGGYIFTFEIVNTVPDNYVIAKLAFLQPSKLHVSKTLLKEFITTFVVNVSHLSGENFNFQK